MNIFRKKGSGTVNTSSFSSDLGFSNIGSYDDPIDRYLFGG